MYPPVVYRRSRMRSALAHSTHTKRTVPSTHHDEVCSDPGDNALLRSMKSSAFASSDSPNSRFMVHAPRSSELAAECS